MTSYSYLPADREMNSFSAPIQILQTDLGKSKVIGVTYAVENAELIVEALNSVPPVDPTEDSDNGDEWDSPPSVDPTEKHQHVCAMFPQRHVNPINGCICKCGASYIKSPFGGWIGGKS